jgi:hypothetical protein
MRKLFIAFALSKEIIDDVIYHCFSEQLTKPTQHKQFITQVL